LTGTSSLAVPPVAVNDSGAGLTAIAPATIVRCRGSGRGRNLKGVIVKSTAIAVAAVMLFGSVASAQIGEGNTGDERVRAALEELGLSYEIDGDGDFKVVFEFEEDGRSQLGYINSGTEQFELFEIREIWSPGYQSDIPFTADVANRLLEDSFEKKLGAWQTMINNDQNVAVFAAKVAANSDAASLYACLKLVLVAADEIEKELLGTDDF
jgi:hypothetical protein